jgi:hypothetical protein
MYQYFLKNKINYTIDKFHITSSRFKIYIRFKVKTSKIEKYIIKLLIIFFNSKYKKLLQCLEDSKSFIRDSKLEFLNKTIRLIKNNEEGVINQTL